MSDIIIIGGGGHAKVVISILRKINQYNIIGYSSLTNEGDILGLGDNGGAEKTDDEAKKANVTKIPNKKSSLKDSRVKGGSQQRGRQPLWRTPGTLGKGAIRKN